MHTYQATSSDTRNFTLSHNGKTLGELLYQKWFAFKATLSLADLSTYQLEPKGFWGTTIELKDNEKVLLHFKMHWNGHIVITTHFEHIESHFIFKHKGIFKNSYVLLDSEEQELLLIQPNFKWNKFNYDYTLTTTDKFDKFENRNILLLTMIHCTNYYMSMMTTIVSAS